MLRLHASMPVRASRFGLARLSGVLTRRLLILLLASQYVIVQLATGVLYGDAPRNMHWGILTAEQPGFLLGQVDQYERIKGFAPDPVSLASFDLYTRPQGTLHAWWGPVVPLLFAGTWLLTRSYGVLQSMMPLAGAAVVVLAYLLARTIPGRKAAFTATLFFACFPLFRDYASTAYAEAFSTLMLTATLYAYWRQRTVLTVLLGTLAALTKMDLLFLYSGIVGICLIYSLAAHDRTLALRHQCVALIGPVILSAPWVWLHYLAKLGGSGKGLSFGLFTVVVPQMLELLFYMPWYCALITLAAIGVCVYFGLRNPGITPFTKVMLGSWLALGLCVLLVYAATPGAGNSPRIMLPALPALAVLFAHGFHQLRVRWWRCIGLYLVGLCIVVNVVVITYYADQGARVRSYAPVWDALRSQPRGYVLTDRYWEAILYARQPATWFEADEVFQRNIMHNKEHFARYVTHHPISYVVLPAQPGELASRDVYQYLDQSAQRTDVGNWLIYTRP